MFKLLLIILLSQTIFFLLGYKIGKYNEIITEKEEEKIKEFISPLFKKKGVKIFKMRQIQETTEEKMDKNLKIDNLS